MSSYSYQIDRNVCVVAFEGEVTFELMLRALKEYTADPEFRADMPRIFDLRRYTDVMGLRDLMRAAEMAAELHPAGRKRKIAVVCGDAMFEHIVKLYREVLRQRRDDATVEIQFFLNMEGAWAWVGEVRPSGNVDRV